MPPDASAFIEAVTRLHTDETAWKEALAAQEAYIDALNKADRGRVDAEALVNRVSAWKKSYKDHR